MSTDAPTIEERYARAMRSSHLEVTEHPGDVDKIIAAGWIRDGLATTLYRLRMEFDGAKAAQAQADANMRRRYDQAAAAPKELPPKTELKRGAKETLDAFRERQRAYREARTGMTRKEVLEDATREALTSRLMILMSLKSLHRAKHELADYAQQRANKGRHMLDNRTVDTVAGRVLDAWMDPLCHHCQGRGFNGASHRGEMQTICRPCRGTTKRLGWIGRTAAEQAFSDHLLSEIERMLGAVSGQMRRGVEIAIDAKAWISEQAKGGQ
jgi:hypothetical protein